MAVAYINRIATAVPPHDVHAAFLRFAHSQFRDDRRASLLFRRMAKKSGIEHRYSVLAPSDLPDAADADNSPFYARGEYPDIAARMRRFDLRLRNWPRRRLRDFSSVAIETVPPVTGKPLLARSLLPCTLATLPPCYPPCVISEDRRLPALISPAVTQGSPLAILPLDSGHRPATTP